MREVQLVRGHLQLRADMHWPQRILAGLCVDDGDGVERNLALHVDELIPTSAPLVREARVLQRHLCHRVQAAGHEARHWRRVVHGHRAVHMRHTDANRVARMDLDEHGDVGAHVGGG